MRVRALIALGLLVLLQGCDMPSREERGVVVAECCGKYLYETDLAGVVPPGMSVLDSLARVNAFVDSWVRRELLIHQSESNLSKEELDFSKQLRDYRNSMVVYAYETKLMAQNLDTVVSDDEIAEYYEANKDNFVLHQAMVKVAYVVMEGEASLHKDVEGVMRARDTLDLHLLDALASDAALSAYLDVDTWVKLDDLLDIVPIEVYNAESFLKKNRFVTFEKDKLCYMVRFVDYLLDEDLSPLEVERNNIKSVILMKRKKQLMDELNAELFERAKEKHLFEVYTGATVSAR